MVYCVVIVLFKVELTFVIVIIFPPAPLLLEFEFFANFVHAHPGFLD